MNRHFLCAILLASCVLGACNKTTGQDPEPPTPQPVPDKPKQIPIKLSTGIQSKATETAYESGDEVGLYVVNFENGSASALKKSGNHVDNLKFTFNGTQWSSATQAYWKDESTKADFYCYYPYSSSVDVSGVSFSVKKDQSTQSALKSSVFLWGKTAAVSPTSDPVLITTLHRNCKVVVNVVPGTGYTDETLAQKNITVTLCSLKCSGKVDLSTGSVSADGTESDIIPYHSDGCWVAYLVPQAVQDANLVKVTVDDDTFYLRQSMTFEANKVHNCNLVVNRIGEGVNIGIGDWENDGSDFGGVLE